MTHNPHTQRDVALVRQHADQIGIAARSRRPAEADAISAPDGGEPEEITVGAKSVGLAAEGGQPLQHGSNSGRPSIESDQVVSGEVGYRRGRSTVFEVVAPRCSLRAASDARPGPHGANEVVPVVDDEATVRMVVRERLEDAGYTVLEASDGAESMRVLRSTAQIDLLISNVGLPGGINGRQLADAARVFRSRLKVLSGYAENSVMGNGHLDSGIEVMTKPFALESMAQKVRQMIGTKRI